MAINSLSFGFSWKFQAEVLAGSARLDQNIGSGAFLITLVQVIMLRKAIKPQES